MHLGPHHFQAQSAFFESALHFTSSTLCANSLGFAGLTMNAEALKNGVVAIARAYGIMPDGLVFQIPDVDPAPPARKAADVFTPTANRLRAALAVPKYRPGDANCNLDATLRRADTRYTVAEREMFDETTGKDEKPIRLGQKNFRLIFENESTEGFDLLPLAVVVRDGAGGFRYDPAFVPSCLSISASPFLLDLLRRLVQLLEEKSAMLSAAARGRNRFTMGLSPGEVATFWFLHAINSGLAPLSRILASRQVHPEDLYQEMLRLGGALCTFSLDARASGLPSYDHANLTECFDELDQHVRKQLDFMVPTNFLSIPMQAEQDCMYEGTVNDPRCFGPSQWILGIRSNLGEAELIRQTPKLAKLCSAAFTVELVRRAMAGLRLTHLPSPPAAIAPRVDWQYFSIERSGPCWEHIVQSKKVSVYLPIEIPQPETQILVLLDA